MEVLRGRRGVRHPDVVLGAELQEALEARAGVLRSLALVAVGQEEHEAGELSPLLPARRDELVDRHLRGVGEVAELGFPQHELALRRDAEAVFETDDRHLGER